MDAKTAGDIYDILITHADANPHPDARYSFIYSQQRPNATEYRFMGCLGFGGKFWINTGYREDGSWGEKWYVSAYPEDMNDDRRATIDRTNHALAVLRGTDMIASA